MVTCINYAPPIKTQKYNETEKLSDAKKKNKKKNYVLTNLEQ